MRPGHPLVLRLGMRAATALAEAFGGEIVEVPTRRATSIEERNAAIRAEAENGASVHALAQSYGLTVRHVRRILNGERTYG